MCGGVNTELSQDPGHVKKYLLSGFTLLHYACDSIRTDMIPPHVQRQLGVVSLLLHRGADVNARAAEPAGLTPLHMACGQKSLGLAKALVEAGGPRPRSPLRACPPPPLR